MRPLLFLSASFIACQVYAQQNVADGTNDSTLTVGGKVLVANAGFAPVPAFSFDHPIAIGYLSLKKGRFSFEPDFALGLNGKPWMANNWFRFIFAGGSKARLNAGISPILFFKNETIATGEAVIQAQRNLTFEWAGDLSLSEKWSLNFTHRYNRAYDTGALSGHSFDLNGTVSDIGITEMIAVVLKPQLLYFDFTGNVDGFLASASMRIEHRRVPLSIYGQGVLPVWTEFAGNSFKWNAGFVYAF